MELNKVARILDGIDVRSAFAEDGWIASFAKVTRPLAVTMTVAIPALGAMSIGVISLFSAEAGASAALNSTDFLKGIPNELYLMIGTIATGYIGFKSWETKSPPPPEGRASPEGSIGQDPAFDPLPDPTMAESDIVAADYPRSTLETRLEDVFDEDAGPMKFADIYKAAADRRLRDLWQIRTAEADPEDPLPVPLFGQVEIQIDQGPPTWELKL